MSSKKPLGDPKELAAVLIRLAETIDERAVDGGDSSYTAKLLKKGPSKSAQKIVEEAGEIAIALVSEGEKEVAGEAGDLLYHLLVGLRARGVTLDEVAEVLSAREGRSGLEEKAARTRH